MKRLKDYLKRLIYSTKIIKVLFNVIITINFIEKLEISPYKVNNTKNPIRGIFKIRRT